MDKRYARTGAIPLAADMLYTNLFAETGIVKLAEAVIGAGPAVHGLACTPTSPASMQVQVGPGEIYKMASLLPVAYSDIPLDSTHQVLKQGILLDLQTLLSCPAPGTIGQSINYLVQVAFLESDADPLLLQYYNASNPSQALSGNGNSGTADPTTRKSGVAVQIKAGTAAATGSQVTPTPDAGFVGLWVVTVANGAATITGGNIVAYAGAPFLLQTLANLRSGFSSMQVFTASGNFTVPNGVTQIKVRIRGGGGAGGFSASGVPSAGGGGGGYSEKIITGLVPGAVIAVTIGAAGAAAGSATNPGGTGGTTSFAAYCTATGGAGGGGAASVAAAAAGGAPGTGASGDVNDLGDAGDDSLPFASGFQRSGRGGGPGGARGVTASSNTAGIAGFGYGGGGSGGIGLAGGAGKAGLCIVEW